MRTIIIAGGAGTRLWPLSTSTFPKQFLEIDDSGRSLLQHTYDRVALRSDSVYIVSSQPVAEITASQLPEIKDNIVVEPSRRGVANALFLGLRRLELDGIPDDEPLFIIWSDHLIRDVKAFTECVDTALSAVASGANLVQFGIVPTHASTGLGYIKKGSRSELGDKLFEIDDFKYQPDQQTANDYFSSGQYLWNAGYFITTASYIKAEIKRESPDSYKDLTAILTTNNSELSGVYDNLNVSLLDHVLNEKMKNALTIACTFDWMDVGNFRDLHSVSDLDDEGSYIKGAVSILDVSDSYIRNDLDTPLAVIGLDNVVVVNSPQGILVMSKSHAQRVGEVAKTIISRQ
jgi:mannose-1-phosphate guanylyltransferase